MKVVTLPNATKTSKLGFGCGYILPENRHLLEVAYDVGIRHFDVAPAYGRGLTESLVGDFARSRPDVTVTTKYGIRPPKAGPLYGPLRQLLRPAVQLLRRVPTADRSLSKAIGDLYSRADFTASDFRQSLERSRRLLRKDTIDILLMHEAGPSELTDPALLECLQAAQAKGTIGSFGVGGRSQRLPDLIRFCPEYCDVLQFEWSVDSPLPASGNAFCAIFRTAGGPKGGLRRQLKDDAQLSRQLSQKLGVDLTEPGTFERLSLRAAWEARPEALVLISTTRTEHLVANVEALNDPRLAPAAARFASVIAGSGLRISSDG